MNIIEIYKEALKISSEQNQIVGEKGDYYIKLDQLKILLASAQPTWLPISEAPREGTKIDLWFPAWGRQVDCFWGGPLGRPGWCWKNEDDFIGCFPNQEPTHFMRLPKGPGENE